MCTYTYVYIYLPTYLLRMAASDVGKVDDVNARLS